MILMRQMMLLMAEDSDDDADGDDDADDAHDANNVYIYMYIHTITYIHTYHVKSEVSHIYIQHLKQSSWVLQSFQPAWRSSAHDAGRRADLDHVAACKRLHRCGKAKGKKTRVPGVLFRGRRQGRQPLNMYVM